MAKKKTAKKKTAKKKTAKKKTAKKKTPKKKTAKKKRPTKKNTAKYKADRAKTLERIKEESHARVLPVSPELSYARAVKALRTETSKFEQQPGKLFFDVGQKFTNGRPQREFALRMHVDQKAEPGPHCICKHCLDGLVPTDVIQSNFVQAVGDSDSGAKIFSEGNSTNDFGTLGLGVRGLGTNSIFFLTCTHVLTDSFPPPFADVVEHDGDFLGVMTRAFDQEYRFNDDLDAALFRPSRSLADSELGRFDQLSMPDNIDLPSVFADPRPEDVVGQPGQEVVYKIGATSRRVSSGFIDSVSLDSGIPIVDGPNVPGLNRRPNASPESHFLVRSAHTNGRFAEKGDSGAMVFSGDGRILGMIRAVSDNAGTNPSGFRAVVTKMTKIRDEFNLRVLS